MPASPVYTDGAAEYGTALLTITPAGGGDNWQAVCDGSFTVTRPSRRVERRNQWAEPAGAFGIAETANGRCTIYLPANKRAKPGDTFVTDVTGSTVWIITDTEDPYEADDYRKQTLTFYQKLTT